MVAFASVVLAARAAAARHGALATCGKVVVTPNGVNADRRRASRPGSTPARPDDRAVRGGRRGGGGRRRGDGGTVVEESWTDDTPFDAALADRLAALLGAPATRPVLATGAGHDAGVLAAAGVPTAMLFVRNPTGVSHSPAEHADRADCLAGVDALAAVARRARP